MSRFSTIRLFFALLLVLVYAGLFAQSYTIKTDHPDGLYDIGETVVFKVASNVTTDVTYKITRGKYTDTLQVGTLSLQSGQTSSLSYVTQKPGGLILEISNSWTYGAAGAIVSIDKIELFEPEPADFDAFWTGVKSELQQVPINPKIVLHGSTAYHDSYTVQLGNIDNRHVYGMLHVPKGQGPFPAIVELPAYGSGPVQGSGEFADRTNCIVLSVSIHNAPVTTVDPNAYKPDDPSDKNLNYHKHSVTSGIRAIDYLMTRSDFNGTDIGLIGESQGAGLALLVAGVDPRVKLMGIASPALASHAGLLYGHASGFPSYLNIPIQLGDAVLINKTLGATGYYDAAIAAKRFHGTTLFLTSHDDEVCLAETQFMASNYLDGTKIHIHNLSGGHNDRPRFREAQRGLFRRYFSNTEDPPFPWAQSNIGYEVSAGADKLGAVNTPISLIGKIEKEQVLNPSIPVEWKVLSGPGETVFTDKNQFSTSVSFSLPGYYTLEFSGKDVEFIDSEGLYFMLSDRVVVHVLEGENTPPTVALTTLNETVNGAFQVSATFNEAITDLELSDFKITGGAASNLTGSDILYEITVAPTADVVSIELPKNMANDMEGLGNIQSNKLVVNYVDPADPKVDLELIVTADHTVVEQYDEVTFYFSLTNNGTSVAHEIQTLANLPLGLNFLQTTPSLGSYMADTGQWDVPELEVGQTVSLIIIAKMMTNTPVTYFAQVINVLEKDVDSTPNNNVNSIPIEDDETAVTVFVESDNLNYCEPGFDSGAEWISRFKLLTIDNESGKENYGDFTNLLAVMNKGISTDFRIEPSFQSSFQNEVYTIWIDFNQDGKFDSEEIVYQLKAPAPLEQVYPILGSIVIPKTALEGKTRMRVSMKRGIDAFAPCATQEQGEVEDYAIFINNATAVSSILNFSVSELLEGAQSTWITDNVSLGAKFFLEKAVDGTFQILDSLDFEVGNNLYKYWDHKPFVGMNYYRVKLVEGGVSFYSSIAPFYVMPEKVITASTRLFPNITSTNLRLNVKEFEGSSADIYLVNTLGQIIYKWEFSDIQQVLLPLEVGYLQDGLYFLNVQIKGYKPFAEHFFIKR